MLDYVIRSGTLIDGTGEAGRRADVGIRDGRIVAIGRIDEPTTAEFDAAGLMVVPGVIDPHTGIVPPPFLFLCRLLRLS